MRKGVQKTQVPWNMSHNRFVADSDWHPRLTGDVLSNEAAERRNKRMPSFLRSSVAWMSAGFYTLQTALQSKPWLQASSFILFDPLPSKPRGLLIVNLMLPACSILKLRQPYPTPSESFMAHINNFLFLSFAQAHRFLHSEKETIECLLWVPNCTGMYQWTRLKGFCSRSLHFWVEGSLESTKFRFIRASLNHNVKASRCG